MTSGVNVRLTIGDRTRTHGLSSHALFDTWESMICRCYNEKAPAYKYYGARGVTVCEEWKNNPAVFIEWALKNGWVKGRKIDKDILSKKAGLAIPIYSPATCCIVTSKVNSNNTTRNHVIEYMGEAKTLQQWCEDLNLFHKTIRTRIKRGWGAERAFTTPINEKRYGPRSK